jgi:hypothetical protein
MYHPNNFLTFSLKKDSHDYILRKTNPRNIFCIRETNTPCIKLRGLILRKVLVEVERVRTWEKEEKRKEEQLKIMPCKIKRN